MLEYNLKFDSNTGHAEDIVISDIGDSGSHDGYIYHTLSNEKMGDVLRENDTIYCSYNVADAVDPVLHVDENKRAVGAYPYDACDMCELDIRHISV